MAKLILSLDHALLNEYPLDQERLTIGRRPTNDVQIDNLAVSGEHAAVVKLGNDFYIEDLNSTNGTLVNATPIKKHLLQHEDLIEFGKYQIRYINEKAANNALSDADFEKTMIIRPSAMRNVEQATPAAPLGMPIAPAASPEPAMSPVKKVSAALDDASDLSAIAPETDPAPAVATPPPTSAATPRPEAPVSAVSSTEAVGKIQVLNGSSAGRELVLNKALTTLGKPGVQVAVITKRPNGYFITHVEGKVFPIVNGATAGAQAFALKDHDVIELAGVKMEFYLSRG
jgi:predicted component of type VI protein secretion system